MNIDKKIQLHNETKKEISINDHPADCCDVCGRELTEPPYMNMGRTICQACFWDGLKKMTIRKGKTNAKQGK